MRGGGRFSASPILTSCPPQLGWGRVFMLASIGLHIGINSFFKELNKCYYFHQIVIKNFPGKWLRF